MNEEHSKLRRKKINIMLNEEERRIITEKAIKYGYGNHLAPYVRAACIYETIFVQDIKGTSEIISLASNFLDEVRKVQCCIYGLYKRPNISKQDLRTFKEQNEKINLSIDQLTNVINAKLNISIIKKKMSEDESMGE